MSIKSRELTAHKLASMKFFFVLLLALLLAIAKTNGINNEGGIISNEYETEQIEESMLNSGDAELYQDDYQQTKSVCNS